MKWISEISVLLTASNALRMCECVSRGTDLPDDLEGGGEEETGAATAGGDSLGKVRSTEIQTHMEQKS